MPDDVSITANGDSYTITPGILLTDFLRAQGQEPARVVVERNGFALAPSEVRFTRLQAGDRLEIVRVVAGG